MQKISNYKKNKKQDSNEDIRRMTWSAAAIGITIMIMVLFISLRNISELSLQELNRQIPHIFYYLAFCLIVFGLSAIITFTLFKFLDSKTLKTSIHLLSNKINNRLIAKNSNSIRPCLRSFLYELLARNNDMLQLKLGQDQSCLIVNGADVRKNCVFYRFSLITNKPPHEDKQLRQIIQGFICSELNDYGIFGLSSTYKSITTQCYSVYLDRCFYDESNSSLVFDLLYICTEQSANYFNQAVVRDTENPKAEKTVFDDEII